MTIIRKFGNGADSVEKEKRLFMPVEKKNSCNVFQGKKKAVYDRADSFSF
jgi:hypothetical protein